MSLNTFTTPLDHASFAISSLYDCVPIAATQHQLQAYEKFISKCNKSQERVETALRYFLYPALMPNSESGFEMEKSGKMIFIKEFLREIKASNKASQFTMIDIKPRRPTSCYSLSKWH
jgi:hypothetical protein